jgi:hypothetical protein
MYLYALNTPRRPHSKFQLGNGDGNGRGRHPGGGTITRIIRGKLVTFDVPAARNGGSNGGRLYPIDVPPSLAPVVAAPMATTPVPPGFSQNQIYVATDGSQWIYSAAQGRWINIGIPYSVNAPSATSPVPAIPAVTPTPAPAAPIAVTVAPAASPSVYQPVLDFLTGSTLISGVPNWGVGLGAVLLVKLVGGTGKGR